MTVPANLAAPAMGGRLTASLTISADTYNYVLNTAKVAGYVAGSMDVTLTINSGIYVGSTSTAAYGLNVDTSWAAGDKLTIINNGFIVGRGGNGHSYTTTGPGEAGGPALRVQRAVSINNVGTIGGGGGGGFSNVAVSIGGGGGQGYNGGLGGGGGATNGTKTTAGTGVGNGGTLGTAAVSGGAGGAAVVGNANITWIATGTRLGSIS